MFTIQDPTFQRAQIVRYNALQMLFQRLIQISKALWDVQGFQRIQHTLKIICLQGDRPCLTYMHLQIIQL